MSNIIVNNLTDNKSWLDKYNSLTETKVSKNKSY